MPSPPDTALERAEELAERVLPSRAPKRRMLVIVNPCLDDVFGCSGFVPRPIAVSSGPATEAVRDAWLAPEQEQLGPRPSQIVTWHRIEVASDAPADALRAAAVRLAVERLEAQDAGGM